MRQVDQALDDERLLEIIQDAWKRLCKKSKTRGRPGTPAEVILRLLVLKHIRDWSFEELEREVCANFVYRQFTRIGGGKVPDNKSISRFSRQLGPEVIENLHQCVVAIAQEKKIIQGRKLRVDTTVDVATLCLYLAISLKTLIADLRYPEFAKPALDA